MATCHLLVPRNKNWQFTSTKHLTSSFLQNQYGLVTGIIKIVTCFPSQFFLRAQLKKLWLFSLGEKVCFLCEELLHTKIMVVILLARDFPFLVKLMCFCFFLLSSPVLTLARCSEFLTRETKNSGLEETLDSTSWENQS